MKNKTVFFLVPLCFWIGSAYAQEEYFFDDSLLKGWGLRQDQIARYTQSGHFEPGTYEVEALSMGSIAPAFLFNFWTTQRLDVWSHVLHLSNWSRR